MNVCTSIPQPPFSYIGERGLYRNFARMGWRSLLARPFAAYVVSKHKKAGVEAEARQLALLSRLVERARDTEFGQKHKFGQIKTYEDFVKAVPVRDYEELRPYIDRVVQGEPNVLWPGKPVYLAKTSGTTSGVKYIPLTKESIPNHINGARDALLHYVHHTGRASFLDRKMIFLSGSPALDKKNGIRVGRLSGIVNHHVPGYLRTNQLPSLGTNMIEDWEQKLDRIIDETLGQPMSLISGIPPWVQMYFDRIIERTGKPIREVFPEFGLFVYGGVNFEPYRRKMFGTIGQDIDSIETFPASEGFFAFQDHPSHKGLLLQIDSGIFFEFIPQNEFGKPDAKRLHIGQVEVGKVYALVVSNNAGLWSYSVGDLVRFTSLKPPRVVVAGRTSHYISAFGEHVIGEEVERAMRATLERFAEAEVSEFTVVPNVSPEEGIPRHEWFVEFAKPPANLPAFARSLDQELQKLNIYYKDLLTGNILETLHIITLKQGAFADMMKASGRLGGQNKVPRLANDRKLAEALQEYITGSSS